MQAQVVEYITTLSWLDRASDAVHRVALRVLGTGERRRRLRDFLHGTWLGHPLHPAVTDVPIGAWTATALLDALDSRSRAGAYRRAADAALALGLGGAVVSAASGVADWSWTYGQTRRVGFAHALLNSLAMLCYGGSLLGRLIGRRRGALGLSTAGYLCALGGAFLGGELVYRLGMAVNRNAWTAGPPDFSAVMPASGLPEGRSTRATVDGVDLLLVRRGGQIWAVEQTCSHEGGPLAEGELRDETITCPWHGSQFRITDGAVVHGPATAPLPRFEVRVREGMIEVRRA